MSKTIFLILFLTSVKFVLGQTCIDTVKVYNVYCSIKTDTNTFFTWGGNCTSFYPPVKCPEPEDKYYKNYMSFDSILHSGKFFWIRLYDTTDLLLFEGLKVSDCILGPFICYYPNGQIKIKGQYSGYKISKSGEYIFEKCSGKPKGIWEYYDINGILIRREKK